MILALALQFAGLTAQREIFYAQAWNLPVTSSDPRILSFEQKAAGTHVMTLVSDWECWCSIGTVVLPKGSAVFVDSSGRPRWTDVGWPIWRSFGALPHGKYPVAPGDPLGAVHVMSNRYPWPSESVVSSTARRTSVGPRHSFLGKLWHWLRID